MISEILIVVIVLGGLIGLCICLKHTGWLQFDDKKAEVINLVMGYMGIIVLTVLKIIGKV